ncbi:hypothetical protein F4677DRAFT_81451 [Hypoxylon crocopeplum]|nr:hypothetical protein F4677DRAFT_81451 [Hypoxylon crocopeplum]
MARKNNNEGRASSVGDNHAQLLYQSLEQYNKEQKRTKRPSVLLVALIFLFLSSAGGIALAIVLILQPVEIQAACIARDLILFASGMALFYICLHIRGAGKDYRRSGPGPPQIYGDYLLASALLVARLGIAVWIAALVATAVMIAKAVPTGGLAGTAPYLNLVICIGAIPAFVVISATIERNATPFATTGLSRSSFLTNRVNESTDELTADLSVSRRASLQRKESKSESILTLPTAEIFRLGSPNPTGGSARNTDPLRIATRDLPIDRTELMANSPIGATHNISTAFSTIPASSVPPMLKVPLPLSKSPPQPVYNPGGWRSEWNHIAQQVGVSRIPEASIDSASVDRSPYVSSAYSSASGGSHTSTPSKTSNSTSKGHRATPSTSIASSAHRSRLSTVRYAAEPEVAVRQPIRVIRNPNYSPVTMISADMSRDTIKPPEPVAVPRSAQQPQSIEPPTLSRKVSNFSHPLPRSRGSEVDSAVEMNMPGTPDDELSRK